MPDGKSLTREQSLVGSQPSAASQRSSTGLMISPRMRPWFLMLPSQCAAGGETGGGPIWTTGFPRRVTKMGRPVSCTFFSTPRQVALNTETLMDSTSSCGMATVYHGHRLWSYLQTRRWTGNRRTSRRQPVAATRNLESERVSQSALGLVRRMGLGARFRRRGVPGLSRLLVSHARERNARSVW